MTATKTRFTTTETARLIRKALKQAFPGVKFSVRSSSYAGGSSISVRWMDGPTVDDVNGTVNRYQGADFDGMTDMKTYRDSTLVANEDGSIEEVSYSVDFVSCSRSHSAERTAAAEQEIREFLGRDFDPTERLPVSTYEGELYNDRNRGEWASTIVHQLLYARAA
jgi:hypothetical protein